MLRIRASRLNARLNARPASLRRHYPDPLPPSLKLVEDSRRVEVRDPISRCRGCSLSEVGRRLSHAGYAPASSHLILPVPTSCMYVAPSLVRYTRAAVGGRANAWDGASAWDGAWDG